MGPIWDRERGVGGVHWLSSICPRRPANEKVPGAFLLFAAIALHSRRMNFRFRFRMVQGIQIRIQRRRRHVARPAMDSHRFQCPAQRVGEALVRLQIAVAGRVIRVAESRFQAL